MKTCNRKKLADNVKRTRKVRGDVPKDLRPLFDHVVRLAIDSGKRGYCTRSGMELRHARKLARFAGSR
jgi:hypothetical protein